MDTRPDGDETETSQASASAEAVVQTQVQTLVDELAAAQLAEEARARENEACMRLALERFFDETDADNTEAFMSRIHHRRCANLVQAQIIKDAAGQVDVVFVPENGYTTVTADDLPLLNLGQSPAELQTLADMINVYDPDKETAWAFWINLLDNTARYLTFTMPGNLVADTNEPVSSAH